MTEGGRLVLLAFTAAAAFSDLCLGKIRNVQILLMLAAGAGWLAIHAPDKIPGVAAAMALTLALLLPFWQLGGLGAGDIKLLMVLAPFLGVQWYIVNFVFSDRGGLLRGSSDQISGSFPNGSFCGACVHQRHALSASAAAGNTERNPYQLSDMIF